MSDFDPHDPEIESMMVKRGVRQGDEVRARGHRVDLGMTHAEPNGYARQKRLEVEDPFGLDDVLEPVGEGAAIGGRTDIFDLLSQAHPPFLSQYFTCDVDDRDHVRLKITDSSGTHTYVSTEPLPGRECWISFHVQSDSISFTVRKDQGGQQIQLGAVLSRATGKPIPQPEPPEPNSTQQVAIGVREIQRQSSLPGRRAKSLLVEQQWYGSAAVCPRHGPTRGGMCTKCRR